jgi:tRNA(fMet)-specific endonuclease VapC
MAVRYLLDTNICIYIAKHNPQCVRTRFEQHSAAEIAMSAITLGELRFGAEQSKVRERSLIALHHLESLIQALPLDQHAAAHYGQIRAELKRQGQMIGNNDLWIAAHARSQDWTLVTNNVREFERVDGLKVENWVEMAVPA